jgi:hypothetical protein
MGIHPKDLHSDNPRMQCVVCAKWKRMLVNDPDHPGYQKQVFYGGCDHAILSGRGDTHLAAKGDDDYVCQDCCGVECKRIATQPAEAPKGTSGEIFE